jgi:hypothetical protein
MRRADAVNDPADGRPGDLGTGPDGTVRRIAANKDEIRV